METGIIAAFVTASAMIIAAIIKVYSDHLKRKKHKEKQLTKNEAEINQNIQNQTEILRNKLNADRVCVYLFHNGGNFLLNNRSMKKFSLYFESGVAGIERIANKEQSRPISTLAFSIEKMFQDNFFMVPDTKEKGDAFNYQLQQEGILSYYNIPIFGIEGYMVGFVSIHYVRNKRELNNEEIEDIRHDCQFLVGYLEMMTK